MTMLEEIPTGTGLPRLGEPARDFEAVTTAGVIRLSDFADSWLILFSHPVDFTPVCTTEFMGFAEIYPQLQERGTELLGLSIDSVYSHIAWLRNVEEKTGVHLLDHPLLDFIERQRRASLVFSKEFEVALSVILRAQSQ